MSRSISYSPEPSHDAGEKAALEKALNTVDELCRMEGTWPGYFAWKMKTSKQRKHD